MESFASSAIQRANEPYILDVVIEDSPTVAQRYKRHPALMDQCSTGLGLEEGGVDALEGFWTRRQPHAQAQLA